MLDLPQPPIDVMSSVSLTWLVGILWTMTIALIIYFGTNIVGKVKEMASDIKEVKSDVATMAKENAVRDERVGNLMRDRDNLGARVDRLEDEQPPRWPSPAGRGGKA